MQKLIEMPRSEVTGQKVRVNNVMNIIESIGKTPLVQLEKVTKGLDAKIFLKSEFFNPLASVKDRIGAAMIEAAKNGTLKPDSVVIEPTSGYRHCIGFCLCG